jgi:hypothetical protein
MEGRDRPDHPGHPIEGNGGQITTNLLPKFPNMLRYADPDMLLNNATEAKVRKYREAYAAPDRLLAFLLAIMSTSGRIHGEFLRLL